MTKQELIKNYTIEELAEKLNILEVQYKYEKGYIKRLELTINKKDNEIKQIDDVLYSNLGIKHTDVDTPDEFEKLLQNRMNEAELPFEPIDVAVMLINATYTREKGDIEKALHKAFGNNSETVTEKMYSVNDLKEIAEHLLVYCNKTEVHEK